jgi:hypothetical protein
MCLYGSIKDTIIHLKNIKRFVVIMTRIFSCEAVTEIFVLK